MRNNTAIASLQYICHAQENITLQILEGGCKWIQLRMKNQSNFEVEKQALRHKEILKPFSAKLIINDFPEVALKVKADGVHLGKQDMPVKEARSMLGDDFIIGGTANSLKEMIALAESGADYIGLGPLRFTQTKKKLSPVLGFNGYLQLLKSFYAKGFNTPAIAIGGIQLPDIQPLKDCNVFGIAVSSALATNRNPKKETAAFLKAIQSSIKHINE